MGAGVLLKVCHPFRSAGASLRRYNESALTSEIRQLVHGWRAHTDEASCIFLRTPKYSKGVLIGDGKGGEAPFVRGDPRLREIPFPTRRPTLKEVQGVHARLAAIYVGVASREELSGRERQSRKNVGVDKGEWLQQELSHHVDGNKNQASSSEHQEVPDNHVNSFDFNADPDADLEPTHPDTTTHTRSRRNKKRKKVVDQVVPAVQGECPLPPLHLMGLGVIFLLQSQTSYSACYWNAKMLMSALQIMCQLSRRYWKGWD